jgi:undecaprenyl-diphosphatase
MGAWRSDWMRGGRWVARRVTDYVEPWALVLILLVAACGWVFVELADEVGEGETSSFDTAILLGLRSASDPSDPIGPGWVEEVARDVTALGSMAILIGITLAAAGYLWLAGKRRSVTLVLVSVGGGIAFSSLFKRGFDRPRPDLVPHATEVYTASFPSGHAMLAAVTYLTLAAMLARVQPTRALKVYLFALASFITMLVGVSRIYLGVHWPTDVLAGWTAGAAWALVCWLGASWLGQRRPAGDE